MTGKSLQWKSLYGCGGTKFVWHGIMFRKADGWITRETIFSSWKQNIDYNYTQKQANLELLAIQALSDALFTIDDFLSIPPMSCVVDILGSRFLCTALFPQTPDEVVINSYI